MQNADNLMDDELLFSGEEAEESTVPLADPWQILIVDDEPDVHSMTRMVLADYMFEGRAIDFTSAYTGEESLSILKRNPDTAVVLLDVVMETNTAGLDVARKIRNLLNNQFIRIILRTGQPGFAPEHKVITELDINDYWQKAELTSQRLTTSMTTALRSYRDLRKIERNRQSLAQMAMSVAHQIRNRTMTINGFANLASRKLGPESAAAGYLETISHETERLEEIVDSVSDFASIDSCEHSSADLAAVAEEAAEWCRQYAEGIGRNIEFDVNVETVSVDARPDLLKKVITELLSNAVFFADAEQPRISLTINADSEVCRVQVADNGPGVTPDDMPYVFDPFFTTRPEAVGMGLSIVNRIVGGYNWAVEISGSDKGGASFTVVIPL